MIEKLPFTEIHTGGENMVDLIEFRPVSPYEMQHKINELVDAVNEIMTWRFETDDEHAENCKCAKNAHKSDLEEALEGFPGLFKSNKDEPQVDAGDPVSMLDIFNEMQSMYSSLWNKLEDIHHELRKE